MAGEIRATQGVIDAFHNGSINSFAHPIILRKNVEWICNPDDTYPGHKMFDFSSDYYGMYRTATDPMYLAPKNTVWDTTTWTLLYSDLLSFLPDTRSVRITKDKYTGEFLCLVDDMTKSIQLYAGPDFASLTNYGTIFTTSLPDAVSCRNTSLSYFNGKYYLYYDVRTDKPAGLEGYVALAILADIKSAASVETDIMLLHPVPNDSFTPTDLTDPFCVFCAGKYYLFVGIYGGFSDPFLPYPHTGSYAISDTPEGPFEWFDGGFPFYTSSYCTYDTSGRVDTGKNSASGIITGVLKTSDNLILFSLGFEPVNWENRIYISKNLRC